MKSRIPFDKSIQVLEKKGFEILMGIKDINIKN
jgi:hypothetical protein